MTMRAGRRSQRGAAVVTVLLVLICGARPASASTAAGTVISNTSNATYQDASLVHYNASSNTVTITVQNAPSLTITASSNKTVVPGQTVTDTFTITNTGNAAGDVQFTAGGVTGGTDSGSTTVAYAYNGTSYTSLANLNTALSAVSVAVGGTLTASVVYVVATSAAVGDVQTNLTGTITYGAVNGTAAATSAAVSATNAEVDSVALDALLDVALSSVNNSGVITYTASAVNRTTVYGARDLLAVKTLLGLSSGTGGIFISIKVPQYPAGTPLTVAGNATVSTSSTYGFASGASAQIYSTTAPTGSSGWTLASGGRPLANATYLGVFISGGSCTINGSPMSGVEMCPIASSGSSAGVVPNPAVTLTFSVNASTAAGAANAGSTQTIANSLIGSNGATEYVIGPGIAALSLADGTGDTAAITATGAGINNTRSVNAPSGASSLNSAQSTASYSLANGPYGNPSAIGTYDGSAKDNNHDFTAVSFVSTNATYATSNTTPTYSPTVTTTTTAAVSDITVENTLTNTGTQTDTYTIVATAPSGGWTVTLEIDNAGAPGSALGGAANGATSTASNVSVASGAALNYWAVYTAPSGIRYLSHGVATITATSNGGGASVYNTTANLLYAGFVAITMTATITPNCPSGMSPAVGSACPGGTIAYSIDYRNVVNIVDVSSVPAVSFARVMTKPGTLVICADGTNGTNLGNTWGSTTNGPTAAPVDSTANTTYAYYTGSTGGTSAAGFQTGVTKFIATIGGSTFQLVPYGYAAGTGSQGTITFSVVVK